MTTTREIAFAAEAALRAAAASPGGETLELDELIGGMIGYFMGSRSVHPAARAAIEERLMRSLMGVVVSNVGAARAQQLLDDMPTMEAVEKAPTAIH